MKYVKSILIYIVIKINMDLYIIVDLLFSKILHLNLNYLIKGVASLKCSSLFIKISLKNYN